MRRIFTLCIVAMFAVSSAYGWGRREHAVVAKIAENHLTPKAKQCLYEYMHRRSLVYYASYADDYQPINIDLGWQPSNDKRIVSFPHTFTVDDNCKPIEGLRQGDKYVKNCIHFIEQWASELKSTHAKMNDSVRMTHIAMIVHAMGDMHCPGHVFFAEQKQYEMTVYGETVRYHGYNDKSFDRFHKGKSAAQFRDKYCRLTKDEIKALCEGDMESWIYGNESMLRETYKLLSPTIDYKELPEQNKFRLKEITDQLHRDAGYRLAHVINQIFK